MTAEVAAADTTAAGRILDRWQRSAGRLFTGAGIAATTGAAAGLMADLALATLVATAAHAAGSAARVADPASWLACLAAALAARAGAAAVSRHLAARGARRIVAHVHGELLDRLLRPDRPLSRPDRFGAGATAVAVLDEVDRLAPYFTRYPVARLQATVVPLLCLAAVAAVSPVCALILVLATPLVPLYGWLTGAGAAARALAHADAARGLAVRFHEAIAGLPSLLGLGVVEAEAARLRALSRAAAGHAVAVLRLAFLATAVLELVATVSLALVAGYVGLSLLGYLHLDWLPGRVDLRGGLFALLVAPAYFAPLRALAAAYHERTDAVAAATLIDQTLPAPPATTVPAPAPMPRQAYRERAVDIRADRLTVHYPGCGTAALSTVDLHLPPGRMVLVAGASGAGKSTLLAALAGELGAEQSGRVRWDGVDVRDLNTGQRRSAIGWLRQQAYVFPGTVADNIALGQARRPADIAAAAAGAGLPTTPRALRADVATLSGGQRQRVAIARLLLRDAPVLLLDEPTAHLDPAAEADLLPTLRALTHRRTCIIATHSRALLELADTIVHLDRGRVLPAERSGVPASTA